MNNGRWVILETLAEIILSCRRGCVVEIGAGSSTLILAKLAEKEKVHLYTCDLGKDIPPIFNGHFHFHGSSFDFINQFDHHPSVVFLDGNHDHKITMIEVEFFLKKLVIGGVIFMHDTYPPTEKHLDIRNCCDSYKTRVEYEKKRDIVDIFTWPYTAGNCGLTMIIKKDPERPYYRK